MITKICFQQHLGDTVSAVGQAALPLIGLDNFTKLVCDIFNSDGLSIEAQTSTAKVNAVSIFISVLELVSTYGALRYSEHHLCASSLETTRSGRST